MEIITGYTGENHVTSADDASLYRGILGRDDYVLDVGNKFAATIIDNNTIRIADGDLIIQGHQARIRANDYEEVTIDNGTPGEKRNDLIVARYQKNTTTGIESITLEVVKGTPGETAVDPDVVQEDLSTGGTQRDFVLYRVSLNGLVLVNITSLFTVLPNLKDFMTHLAETANKHIAESGSNENGSYIKFDDGTMICSKKIDLTVDAEDTWGAFYTTPIFNRPSLGAPAKSFISTPVIYASLTSSNFDGILGAIQGVTSNFLGRIIILRGTPDTDLNYRVNVTAIGRWK